MIYILCTIVIYYCDKLVIDRKHNCIVEQFIIQKHIDTRYSLLQIDSKRFFDKCIQTYTNLYIFQNMSKKKNKRTLERNRWKKCPTLKDRETLLISEARRRI